MSAAKTRKARASKNLDLIVSTIIQDYENLTRIGSLVEINSALDNGVILVFVENQDGEGHHRWVVAPYLIPYPPKGH